MALNLTIRKGSTFNQTVRWGVEPIVYRPITNITQAAPALVTSASHGLPDGWQVAIESVRGMTAVNAPRYTAKVITPDTFELMGCNASEFKAYAGGGYVKYNTPRDLTGFVARMKIKDKVGGTVLASTLVGDAPLNVITITVSDATKTVLIEIPAAATEAFTFKKGVYDLEMVSPTGVVTALLEGTVIVTSEITT